MNRLFFLLVFAFQLQTAYSQRDWYNASINFNQSPPYRATDLQLDFELVIDTSATNIWQVGVAQKDSFRLNKRTIVTDTLNSYAANNTSFFDLYFYGMSYSPLVTDVIISHRYETTKGMDGGYILATMDLGKTWINIGDTFNRNWNNPFYYSLYFGDYGINDTITGGIPGFSGSSGGVKGIWIGWGIGAVKQGFGDTLILRFVFQSDSIADNKDGWLIENIEVNSRWTYGINEFDNTRLLVYPNPAKNHITVQALDNSIVQSVAIKDLLGRTIISQTFGGGREETLNLPGPVPGNYLAEVQTDKGITIQKLLVE